jgi:hypothetical protein
MIADFFCIFLQFYAGLECVGHSFAYVAHFVFLIEDWIAALLLTKISQENYVPGYQFISNAAPT